MTFPSDLISLDLKPHGYSMLLKSFGDQNQTHDDDLTHQNLQEFLSRLEEERIKIDVFKRELPLCLQLLTNAVETSRQHLQAYKGNITHDHQLSSTPKLEEFIPIKKHSNNTEEKNKENGGSNSSDKANWMTTAQLWCQTTNTNNDIVSTDKKSSKNNIIGASPKQRNGGGAFLPFSKDQGITTDLGLVAVNEKEMEDHNDKNGGVVDEDGGKLQIGALEGQVTTNMTSTGPGNNNQTHRKARRCWSPDLHRRFVNALHMLGGSQVATPKQIRELMKVDGLTNDEVKSHLQKYRLHTRRPSCHSPQQPSGTQPPPHLVVLGGIWVPPEYNGPTMATLYSASPHPPPSLYCSTPVPSHHFFTNNNIPSPQITHPGHIIYSSSARMHGSSESDGGVNGDRSESMEDGKSESNSYGENGGERKGLAALREDGEESNGSEITLKF